MTNKIGPEQLWLEYAATPTTPLRNRLVLHYLPIVRAKVFAVRRRLPGHTSSHDDLFNAGVIGLMRAVERFEAWRGIKFETYCQFPIYGAIMDELRATDTVPRSVRTKIKRGLIRPTKTKVINEAFGMVCRKSERSRNLMDYCDVFDVAARFLNKRERLIVVGRYMDGMTFKEIGRVVGVHETRAMQLHDIAVAKLQENFHPVSTMTA